MCEEVMGPEKYVRCTGHSTGFHLHYCLPYGTFNRRTSSLKQLFRSKYRATLLNLYNVILAMDPALTNFMESSPFVDGSHIAKDSRIVLYRAMRIGKGASAISGLYSDLPLFGRLPRYAESISDLIMLSQKRYETWRDLVGEKCPEYLDIIAEKHPLQFTWGPLRINKVGTLEYRGMDMNLPSHMVGTSLIIKYLLKKIKAEQLVVKPSDIGIKQPFRQEGDTIFVPPYAYLCDVLQYKSALNGLADAEVYNYSKRMCALAMAAVPDKRDPGLSRIQSMLKNRKTKSDEIIAKVRKEGHSLSRPLDEDFARELALFGCEEFEKEVRQMASKELVIDLEQ